MYQYIKGRVVSTEMEEILLAVEEEGQCHSCGLKDSCSNKTLKLKKSEINYIPVQGERVRVVYKKLLQTSAIIYLFPLMAFFTGIALATLIFNQVSDIIMFMSGLVFVMISLFFLRLFGNKLSKKEYRIQIQPLK